VGNINKNQLKSTSDVTSLLGIGGKTISVINCYRHGSVEVTDILCTDTNHYYIKSTQGQVEVGTTSPEMGTGTLIGGR
jgi:hypothetical protein